MLPTAYIKLFDFDPISSQAYTLSQGLLAARVLLFMFFSHLYFIFGYRVDGLPALQTYYSVIGNTLTG